MKKRKLMETLKIAHLNRKKINNTLTVTHKLQCVLPIFLLEAPQR